MTTFLAMRQRDTTAVTVATMIHRRRKRRQWKRRRNTRRRPTRGKQ
jgi:hypothetical protein